MLCLIVKDTIMKKILSFCSLLVVLSVSVSAREPMYGSVSADFDVKATVDSFVGKTASEPFVVGPADEKVTVTFEVAKMETGKKKRDKEMMHMFHADEFPIITGTASAASVLALEPSAEPVEFPLEVVMHGITKQVTAQASNVNKSGDGLTFDLAFPLILSEYDLKAPSVRMMIRVNDKVNVTSRVTLSTTAP